MAELVVRWTKQSIKDLNNAHVYISKESPQAATSVIVQILGGIEQLQKFPESGRIGQVEGTRELVIFSTSFIIVYRVKTGVIEILAFLHSSKKWP
jgi:toxin ParE1/3/4